MGEKRAYRPRKNSRERIIQGALRVFCYYGYSGTTYEKIAEETGVSKSLVIKHFGTKEDLVVLCMERFLEEFMEKLMNRASQGLDYRTHVLATHEAFKLNRGVWQLIIGIFATPALESIVNRVILKYMDKGNDMVGHFKHQLKPDHDMEAFLFSIIALHLTYALTGMENLYLPALDNLFEQYLLPPDERTKAGSGGLLSQVSI